MNALIKAASMAVTAACVSAAWAQQGAAEQSGDTAVLAWNRIALESVQRAKPTQHQAARLLAYLSLAQHAAVNSAANEEASRDAVAAVSIQVIAELLPSQAAFVDGQLRPGQLREGERALGIGYRLLEQAHNDGFAAKWTGQAPQAAFAWHSLAVPASAPAYPAIGGMRTLIIEAGNAFRPAPPPAIGSARFLEGLAEVRRYAAEPNEETRRIANFYDMTTGTLAAGYWNEQATELARRNGVGDRKATVVLATMNAAIMDALVACHEAKYVYWVPRPSQADPGIKPLIGVPNHPSYPSNHSCLSTAASQVLAHFFPQDRARLETAGTEAGVSRIYAGIHYRFDVDAGEEIGRKVAGAAIARHVEMLARTTQRLLAQTDRGATDAPDAIKPAANEALAMIVPASGVQIYECRPAKGLRNAYEWVFVAPDAELFDVHGQRIGRHYAGPHWEAMDGSRVVGAVRSRAAAPSADAIPWLLLGARSVGAAGLFSSVSSIQRVNTVGGMAPASACTAAAAGAQARMHYSAEYYLFVSAATAAANLRATNETMSTAP